MMNRQSRFGSAISTLAIAAVISGCAIGQNNRESIFGAKVDRSNIGLAMRAQAELERQNYAAAVDLAERAVANTPSDAGFRALLGNAYFAAGRFASAEAAYLDSLTLFENQPQTILKLALVQIAQGKNGQALGLLDAARSALPVSDYGLAIALAGRPDSAVVILNEAARKSGADGQVRQNLALAYALSGDWTMARVVAAQDVPPDQLDGRIQQWMAMATPSRPSDQVAALTGVTPSADPGQPQRLALRGVPMNEALAQLSAPQVQPEAEFRPVVADIPATAPIAYPEPQPGAQIAAVAPVTYPEPQPLAQVAYAEPAVAEAVQELIRPVPVNPQPKPEQAETKPPVALAKAAPKLPTRFDEAPKPASYVAITDEVRKSAQAKRSVPANRSNAASRSPNRSSAANRSNAVVQLGAYSSPDRVATAWETLTRRYPVLAEYTPVRARFDGPNGTVWRLSIKGFATQQEARQRCVALQNRGASCFVRSVAGDAPVQLASR
jgi:Flp pilus assembly protein TadD